MYLLCRCCVTWIRYSVSSDTSHGLDKATRNLLLLIVVQTCLFRCCPCTIVIIYFYTKTTRPCNPREQWILKKKMSLWSSVFGTWHNKSADSCKFSVWYAVTYIYLHKNRITCRRWWSIGIAEFSSIPFLIAVLFKTRPAKCVRSLLLYGKSIGSRLFMSIHLRHTYWASKYLSCGPFWNQKNKRD